MTKYILAFALLIISFSAHTQPIPHTLPNEVGMDIYKLERVDKLINQSIQDKEFPGAVIAVVRYGKIAYLKAYGNKQLIPSQERMTTNTIFDLASLTKPTATALSLMILIERGEIRLLDNVSLYIPEFTSWRDYNGRKKDVKVIDLLTHTSGLPAYPPVKEMEKTGENTPLGLVNYISLVEKRTEPSTHFIYSDLNFVLLQTIIEKVSKQSLQEFSQQNIFQPLGMLHTDYKPSDDKLIAPTEKQKNGKVLKGQVHDPLARIIMNGISGNAGLFSDAEDLAILAAMILNQGRYNNKQILSPPAIRAMTSIPTGYEEFGRTLGWDNLSKYSSNKGDLFSNATFGHTGYTGTSIVIDPQYNTAVIFLTNRVHPNDRGSQTRLRSLIANIVAGSIIEY